MQGTRSSSVPDLGNHIHHVNEPSYQTKSLLLLTIQPSDGPYEDSTKIVRQEVLSPTQKPPIIFADIEINKEDSSKTAETLTEVTTESFDMAASDSSSYIGRLKDQEKKNEKRIKKQEQQLDDHKNCVEEIKTLKDEIRKLKEENDVLKQKIQTLERKVDEHKKDKEEMKYSYQWLEDERDQEKKDRKSMETKLKCLTGNEDLLCLRQLGVDVQVHIYKYVMREDFSEVYDKADIGKIDKFIDERIENPEEKTKAKERLQNLKGENYIKGALSHLQVLKGLRNIGNNVAHPELDEEKIKRSISNLREDNKLDDKRYAHVQELVTMWKELIQM